MTTGFLGCGVATLTGLPGPDPDPVRLAFRLPSKALAAGFLGLDVLLMLLLLLLITSSFVAACAVAERGDLEPVGVNGKAGMPCVSIMPELDPGLASDDSPSMGTSVHSADAAVALGKYDPERESGRDPGRLTAGEGAGVKSSSTSRREACCETDLLCAHGASAVSVVKSEKTSS